MRKLIVITLAVVAGFLFTGCGYNKMVDLEEQVTSQWSQVENVYQRRADLIPNLVNTVKGYAAHEQETLEGVIEARSKATSANVNPENLSEQSIEQFNQAQEGLTSALSRLMVVVERYPDLKANQNFLDLQAQLEGTENRIAVERRKFNQATQSYNAYIRKFPQVIYSGWFGFEKKDYFESQQGADQAPEVEF
ncbi:LemA protein [Tangfeifania diversioriginum]|uniref:LemA protein n=1 Tax=Tangfeifania diversioriginum TaxID=1168035 RepID=A0A1M6P6J7_9BACT|nr:LemA family protein [Tangfeifania diversioriginum]SHK03516.1 LemA protein [Tangfeifania diversioriginum]